MAKSVKHILKQELEIKVGGKLWLESEGERFFGPGPMELLEKIEETGSISNAARAMNMSYKKAWELINHLNTQTNFPVVVPQAGGEKGGGSTLTAEAIELIEYYKALRKRFKTFLENETERLKI
ncbi:winged helix-turn-helix domain-containing protein [Mucilaginibacter sp. BT774]|uniref:winged helix-turn-helix domain-containing protein n=1 Tax=Mucilaginibacter sp. BT774 TaxID=3062276 RepID=UPI002674A2AF|nr:LysR family transcriptional regulator [Mucilaginibacter sp. BT774]MDO3627811.1 LysR family transcriptional regulator [Mucilaginibacter sp. BT774]